MSEHSNISKEALKKELNELENTMHETEQFHTLKEQVTDMKRRGIDPHDSYQKWDSDEKWEHKTADDLNKGVE